jgi:tetratricopeptide (TPR) repeat protein
MTDQTNGLFEQSLALARQGRFAPALQALERLLAQAPDRADALALQAALLTETGAPDRAIPVFERALAMNPSDAAAHSNFGNALARLGRAADAAASYGRALAINPNHALAYCNRAGQLLELDRPAEALADAERAVSLNPGLAAAHRHLSLARFALGDLQSSLASVETALALEPANLDTLAQRGSVLGALGRFAEGLDDLERAVARRPADAENQYRLALARLRHGAFEGGWRAHEHRWEARLFQKLSTGYAGTQVLERLRRDVGVQDIAGQSVLVIDEQGIGDHIMFASMLPDLKRVAAQVTWLSDPRLLGLLAGSFPDVRFLPAGAARELDLAAFDVVLASGGLGRLFRNRAEDFPDAPYLTPSPAVVAEWQRRLGDPAGRRRIGLSWRGGTKASGAALRSIELARLRPLLDRTDCAFISLQYGDVEDEILAVNQTLERPIRYFPAAELDDFGQQAGLVQTLDAVVSVQTALVHLCGAVGVPCLTMVPAVAEWRYGEAGDTLPWYRSVRLLRQTRAGEWDAVIATAAAQVGAL